MIVVSCKMLLSKVYCVTCFVITEIQRNIQKKILFTTLKHKPRMQDQPVSSLEWTKQTKIQSLRINPQNKLDFRQSASPPLEAAKSYRLEFMNWKA